MRFEWDQKKNRENLNKHGVSFEDAAEVFNDPLCLTVEDRTVQSEERLWTIGCVEGIVVLVVVHTMVDDEGEEVVRVISARKATPRERTFYEEAK